MGRPSSRLLWRSGRAFPPNTNPKPLTRFSSSLSGQAGNPTGDPSPAQLLRAIFTGPDPRNNGSTHDFVHRHKILSLIDAEWISGSPPPALWAALKGVHPTTRKEEVMRIYSVNDVSSLRSIAERLLVDEYAAKLLHKHFAASRVMERCEERSSYSELVSLLSDIHHRLARLKLPPLNPTLGLRYAALDLNMPAFQGFLHIRQKIDGPPLQFSNSGSIIKALLETIESTLFERPNYDTRFVLSCLTSEAVHDLPASLKLHEVLHASLDQDRGTWSTYLCLLARLHSRDALYSSWGQYLSGYVKDNEISCHQAYSIIISLIKARRSEEAALFLEQIAQRSGDTLPYFSTFRGMSALLNDAVIREAIPDLAQGREYETLLEKCLWDMEAQLGIRWEKGHKQSGEKVHVSFTPDSAWKIFEDQPLITLDGESAGYDDPMRIRAEISSLGCSRSSRDLQRIVDGLHDQDGCPQDVTVQPYDSRGADLLRGMSGSIEFQWNPEHAPVEFSDSFCATPTLQSFQITPATLGLLRARAVADGVPQNNNKCLHLLQLGSLHMRTSHQDPWEQSGYVVAWDRQFGDMIALYVGRGFGIIDPGPTPSNAPFGSILHIDSTHTPNSRKRFSGRRSRISGYAKSYHLDIDPSLDLEF
ncbi:Uncharacterized protein PECH_007448 [Penicillium ucsense]|uniref:Uncharacterized protein n=1 Tax=Penicillium ucsense TaxID=2839758 RepID=A0A8J8W0W8_9EURO|nr:Uncharacterized protein PECM_007311 [Penicillium ucsense]KAF7734816.1 Uncharacterized protein PECH_007448 [Penicillium ucsense]